ncbi:NUDIX domain-containing protein [Streptomyces sp. SCUT-3]|uniref:NUDIX domain-containing protein n=1 Tax=Streptomyces sp. SCUT-3 TaxID=2684469 RepID=UPI000CAE407D|nr:NUDIX hydrolase [Streptomyces sp. SCUT-3]PLW73726.1 NUDIX hydrolase [Streptomyces sp. DJ]QMV25057.1 NUDIX domain-containing protein [Streptomyces sp. SCUT-3]
MGSECGERPGTPAGGERTVVKRTARAILLDGDHMVLIKRTKPGMEPYWITPGGGVEAEDPTVVDALHREVDEELGGKVADVVPAFVDTVEHVTDDGRRGVKIQHFFACRLESMDVGRRHGPEVDAPCGTYEIVRIPFTRAGIASVDVVPASLRAYLDANIEGIRALLARDLG